MEWSQLFRNNMAKEIVIFPGGYHPFTPGHLFAYNTLRKAFPSADLYVASSDSTSERPFPFEYHSNMGGRPRLGIEIQDLEEGNGVKVTDVDNDMAAGKSGLLTCLRDGQ